MTGLSAMLHFGASVLLLAGLATTQVIPSKPLCDAVGICPIYDDNSIVVHLPHRTRCDIYCRCDHGEPFETPCPEGTWFNAKLEVCDFAEDSGCVPGQGSQTTQTTSPTTTIPSRLRCDALGICAIYDDEFSIVVHLPHRTRCDVYCRCDHGVPFEIPCPEGTWFNAKLEVCDFAEDSGCTPGSGSFLIP